MSSIGRQSPPLGYKKNPHPTPKVGRKCFSLYSAVFALESLSLYASSSSSRVSLCLERIVPLKLLILEKKRVLEEQIVSNGMTKTSDLDDHDHDIGNVEKKKIDLERTKNVTPFYQRVLSALIVEDETEELEENNGERDMSFQYNRDDSPDDTCLPVDVGLNLMLSPFWVFKLRSNALSTDFLVMGELTSPGAHASTVNYEMMIFSKKIMVYAFQELLFLNGGHLF